ncbi:hypothetical protein [Microbacterium suaedae]|uniref:hypothetical protein n=1 Tax=Microbacterium suaedae TaxID=2067813 RepID=UPI0013A624FB|nr:hypothetical protein [Microbacterium suaedae]
MVTGTTADAAVPQAPEDASFPSGMGDPLLGGALAAATVFTAVKWWIRLTR